jgi:hypothetical protein
MSNAFVVPEIAYVYNIIEDLLYMNEPQSLIHTSFGKNEDGYEFIKFGFHLKHGKSEVRLYEDSGDFSYIDQVGKELHSVDFDGAEFMNVNGSFYQAFKSVISFDRQQANMPKIDNTSVNRALFGLAEVN